MINKKIAVFHNFLDNIGGAELFTLKVAREFNADVYTTNIDAEKISKLGFADVLPRVFSIGKVPVLAPFRQQLAFWRFSRLNLGKKYDFYIIGGDWAMSGAARNHPNLWYAHSPLNELWEFKNYVKREMLVPWQRPIYEIWARFNRRLSRKYAKSVDIWACNSQNTRERIKRFYHQEAEVVYFPVDVEKYGYQPAENYWLAINRLAKNKRVELQLKAFAKMPAERLIIVGSYERGAKIFEDYKKYLEKIKPDNVEIISWADDATVKDLYSRAKGFIATALNEDFGLTPVEAMAAGKPVIAPDEGGYRETIIDGVTGRLIGDINEDKIVAAVGELEKNLSTYRLACEKRAQDFGAEIFYRKIKEKIAGKV